jgi:hypothetical protein
MIPVWCPRRRYRPYYTLPAGTQVNIPIAVRLPNGNVMIRWLYPVTDPSDPRYYTFFYFEVYRNSETGTPITPYPRPTTDGVNLSFVLRADLWVDTSPAANSQYFIRAISASGTPGNFLSSPTVSFSIHALTVDATHRKSSVS